MNPTGASRESLTSNPELENSLDPQATFRLVSITQFSQDCVVVTGPDIVYRLTTDNFALHNVTSTAGLRPTD